MCCQRYLASDDEQSENEYVFKRDSRPMPYQQAADLSYCQAYFSTTITLNNGVPIGSVSKMMGHTSIKTTQIYAKVLGHKIGSDMRKILEKVE